MRRVAVIAFVCALPFPWKLRRLVLQTLCRFRIHRTAFISRLALIAPSNFEAEAHSYIGPFSVCKGLELIRVEEHGYIGPFNWITGFPLGTRSGHFDLDSERKPHLIVERHAAITSRHIIDCTDEVRIGMFSTVAGYRTQILTHSIDMQESRQRCKPVRIGAYCFVGTNCVILGGSILPDRSVLGAHSVLASRQEMTDYLYGGSPAKAIKPLEVDAQYFRRTKGYVL